MSVALSPGSTLDLTEDRCALVVSANAGKALKAQVLACALDEAQQRPESSDLARSPSLGIRRGLKPQPRGPAAGPGGNACAISSSRGRGWGGPLSA